MRIEIHKERTRGTNEESAGLELSAAILATTKQ